MNARISKDNNSLYIMEVEKTPIDDIISVDPPSEPSFLPPLKQLQRHLETCIEILRRISFILYEFQEDSQTAIYTKL